MSSSGKRVIRPKRQATRTTSERVYLYLRMILCYKTSRRGAGRYVISFEAAHKAARKRLEHAVTVLRPSVLYPELHEWTSDSFDQAMEDIAPLRRNGWDFTVGKRWFTVPKAHRGDEAAQAKFVEAMAAGLAFLLEVPVRLIEVEHFAPSRTW